MDILWQEIVIGGAVIGAVIYLVKRYIGRRRQRAACAGCCLTDSRHRPAGSTADSSGPN